MHFELFFSGKIPSGNKRNKKQFAQNFRRQMNTQLEALWDTNPLKNHFERWLTQPENQVTGDGAAYTPKHGIEFITLIRENSHLACRLGVHFYEPEGSFGVANDVTDVDNKLKTLFDQLRLPDVPEHVPEDIEGPCHCLLSDDKLIWSVNVQRHRLLRKIDSNSHLTRIEVTVVPSLVTMGNLGLFGTVAH